MAVSTRSDKPRDDDGRRLTRVDVLSTAEAAELLGIPRSTVHYLARRGQLPARRVGRR
jgi:excisionase family DNA binding protein